MKAMRKTLFPLLCCMLLAFFCLCGQAYAKEAHCRYNIEGVTYASKVIKEYINGKAYNVLVTCIIRYYHKGETFPKEEAHSKAYDVAASTTSKAEASALALVKTYAGNQLEAQCKDKKCDKSNN